MITSFCDELVQTLNCWPAIPLGGSPLDIEFEPDYDDLDLCEVCGGRGYVSRPNAICYANEQDAEMTCPACGTMEIN